MRHFTESELTDALASLPLDVVVECMRDVFREQAEGRTALQARIPTDAQGVRLNTMAALIPGIGFGGAKVYTAVGSRFSFLIALFSLPDGRLVATFDGGALTGLRTAAVSALAASYLARPDSRRLAVFGTGTQAASHVEALTRRYPIGEIRVIGRANAQAFAGRMQAATGRPAAVMPAEQALDGADLVVTATRSATPLFDGRRIDDGTTLIAVGSARPNAAEIDAVTVERSSTIVVETFDGMRHEAGDLLLAEQAGIDPWSRTVELGALVTGRRTGRQSPGEINLYESLGNPLEDVAIAALLHRRLGGRRS
ncbi:MAG TPA: ornithine cyclodeaminase family protein [Burkholderiaceae bacterium]|nr:ornithine cyclodeaminase family protein [Burkholderiaceae bacterium]